jgi:hypothetical protein
MREFWPIAGVILAGTLWRITGHWEWVVPQSVEQKIVEWKRKWYYYPIIIRVTTTDPIEDLELLTWSLKSSLPKLQNELGVPVSLEIEWKEPELAAVLAGCGSSDSSEDVQNEVENDQGIRQQFSCLSRRFPEIFWVGQAECD